MKMKKIGGMMRPAVRAVAAAAFALTPLSAQAQMPQNYPSKPVELVIPFAPGGGVDLFGRTVASILTEEKIVPQRIQVSNKPGAGGANGIAEMVTRRKGDLHSLLGIAIHIHVTPLTLGTPHTYKDLKPIAKLFSEYQMMVVRTDSPIKSLKDIENMLREDVGSVKFGGASVGNADHITVSKFTQAVGGDPAKTTYVAYSGGESNAAILGGHVDVGMGGLDLISLVKAGQMRVLAISSSKRLDGDFKDIPTFIEQGYEVTNENWRGIFGPAGMPDEAVAYWREALTKMTQTSRWQEALERNQWAPALETDTFVASLAEEYGTYRSLLQQLGLVK
jgi:putative tricarboxylic transport membrane protein